MFLTSLHTFVFSSYFSLGFQAAPRSRSLKYRNYRNNGTGSNDPNLWLVGTPKVFPDRFKLKIFSHQNMSRERCFRDTVLFSHLFCIVFPLICTQAPEPGDPKQRENDAKRMQKQYRVSETPPSAHISVRKNYKFNLIL